VDLAITSLFDSGRSSLASGDTPGNGYCVPGDGCHGNPGHMVTMATGNNNNNAHRTDAISSVPPRHATAPGTFKNIDDDDDDDDDDP